MKQYVAFLRGVNVGGKKPIRMKQLADILTAAGFRNVRTFIASGNVIFETSAKNPTRMARKMEKVLLDAFGYDITVIIRNVDDLRAIIKLNPFKKPRPSPDEMLFVTFLASPTPVKPQLPLQSETENMEVIALIDSVAFIIARRKKTGWFGFRTPSQRRSSKFPPPRATGQRW